MALLITGVLCSLIAAELYDQAEPLSRWLVRRSAGRLKKEQTRFEEEWLAHLNDCRGNLSKLLHSLGCGIASFRQSPPNFPSISIVLRSAAAMILVVIVWWLCSLLVRKMIRAWGNEDIKKYESLLTLVALILAFGTGRLKAILGKLTPQAVTAA